MDIIKRSKVKILKELARKSWHFFAGLALITGYSFILMYYSEETALVVVVGVSLAAMGFEHVRLEYRPRVLKAIDVLFRKQEKSKVSSMVAFILSFVVIFAVFDYWIAFTAMMMLVLGDAAASLFGSLFGEKKIRRSKTYIGSLAGLLTNLITGFVIMHEYPIVFIPMAITAATVETLTNKLDDNLTVPISAAFAGYLVVTFLNISLTIS